MIRIRNHSRFTPLAIFASSLFKIFMKNAKKNEVVVAALLVLCVTLVVAWEIAAKVASRPFDELRLNPEAFSGFTPQSPQWSIRLIGVQSTPTEPTVIAYRVQRDLSSLSSLPSVQNAPLLIRIVHGYNMVDCMRIKQYKVTLLADARSKIENRKSKIENQNIPPTSLPAPRLPFPVSTFDFPISNLPYQLWRLTSSIDESSIWVTTMLRSADFGVTTVDTRDMAFPRVGNPDDPSWAPTGVKWSSFRHPIRNLRDFIRAKWNASRCDIWTFLGLRQPAWASDEMLTMVTEYHGPPVSPQQEAAVGQYVLQAHAFMLNEFQHYWREQKRF